MSPETLARKLAIAKRRHDKAVQAKIVRYRNSNDPWWVALAAKLAANPSPFATAIPYRPRLKLFKGCNGKLTFDPSTMQGRSYNWYTICDRIDGVFILNTYRYSVTTSGHVRALRALFKDLGISYREVEAPSGLQKLTSAVDYHCNQLARGQVAEKHGRCSRKRMIAYHRQALKLLAKLGYKATEADHAAALQAAESARSERLKRAKAKRLAAIVERITGDKPSTACEEAFYTHVSQSA